jgi:2-aminoadipate transaminase
MDGVQNVPRAGIIELVFGEPDPALLPVTEIRRACATALDGGRTAALPYGANEGPPELRRLIAARIAATEDRKVPEGEIAITGGNSLAFDQVLTRFTTPGDTVLVELPTYILALGIVRDHHVDLEAVPVDDDGLDVVVLERILDALALAGRRARLLYTIPTFQNPTGTCLSAARRRRLVELAAAHDLLIVEDDVYRELVYDGVAPPSLWSIAPVATVLRLGSFAKTIAPGLRVGWLNGSATQVEHFAAAGFVDSGGCPSHFSASVVACYLEGGGYPARVERLRSEYRARRDALAAALTEHLPPGSSFVVPGGGFFIWVTLPEGLTASALLPVAERHGVSFVPAAQAMLNGDDGALRLAFSMYPPAQLAEGAKRLGAALGSFSAGR